jgi:hypothetical protein
VQFAETARDQIPELLAQQPETVHRIAPLFRPNYSQIPLRFTYRFGNVIKRKEKKRVSHNSHRASKKKKPPASCLAPISRTKPPPQLRPRRPRSFAPAAILGNVRAEIDPESILRCLYLILKNPVDKDIRF